MLVICVVRSTTGIEQPREAAPLRAASRIAPTAPTEAASVGVATPPRIEPSTARMSASGATSTATSRRAKREAVRRRRVGRRSPATFSGKKNRDRDQEQDDRARPARSPE